jgi:hypothetical protein
MKTCPWIAPHSTESMHILVTSLIVYPSMNPDEVSFSQVY